MQLDQLNDHFAIPGILRFEDHNGLNRAIITTPAADATVYLHGAHITHWQPHGHQPVLFLSPRSDFAEDKPIRGGIPICFPWFGPRRDAKPGPSHGFARLQSWELAFAAITGDTVHLTLTLGPSDASRALGFDSFRVACQLAIGATLSAEISVVNTGQTPLVFEEALHTYFAVGDAQDISITGLEGASFTHKTDKTDSGALKVQPDAPLRFTGVIDRVYPGTLTPCVLRDPILKRTITVEKTGSATTVIWNPWAELTAKIPDMEPEGWRKMACIETANAGPDQVTLAPAATHSMKAIIQVANSPTFPS